MQCLNVCFTQLHQALFRRMYFSWAFGCVTGYAVQLCQRIDQQNVTSGRAAPVLWAEPLWLARTHVCWLLDQYLGNVVF